MEKDAARTVELDANGWPAKGWLERVYLEEGLGTREIARMTGRGVGRISMLLRAYGISTRQPPPPLEREWLVSRYCHFRRPIAEIAAEAGVTYDHVMYSLRRHAIPTRRKVRERVPKPSREWLHEKYVTDGLSTEQLCELTGYSKPGLLRLLRSYDIARRGVSLPEVVISREQLHDLHVVQGLTAVRIAARLGCHHTTVSRLIREYGLDPGRPLVNERKQPPVTRDELWKLYWVDSLSMVQIAQRFGVHASTALRWFRQLDVERRPWNGGDVVHRAPAQTGSGRPGREGQEFTPAERDRIMRRDGDRCRMPGCSSVLMLEVHHILPVKAGGTRAQENGITLCHNCHERIKGREMCFVLLFQELVLNS